MCSDEWDRAYAACELTWSVQPHPHVEEVLGDLLPGRAVELGCGEGRQAIWLASRGWEMTAVDFSPVAVARGRKIAERHGTRVEWVVADVLDYNPPAPFDLAMILYLHIHRDEFVSVLAKTAAALAPGGTLFVLGWDRQNFTDGIGGPRPPEVLYSIDDMVGALKGLRIVRAEQVLQAGSSGAVDTLLTARRPAS
ncbi:MAG: class I SAM-dependent methyltransferase [Pseudonocardiaceae bacterium]